MFKYNIEELYCINNKIYLKGWIILLTQESYLRIEINDLYVYGLNINKIREDVYDIYNDITDTNILGFDRVIDFNKDINQIKFQLVTNNKIENIVIYGKEKISQLNVDNNSILFNIEEIKPNEDNIILNGWAISKYDKNVDILINKNIEFSVNRYAREDVNNNYKDYYLGNIECGFSITINNKDIIKNIAILFKDSYNTIEYEIDTAYNKNKYIIKYLKDNLNVTNISKGIKYISKYGIKSMFDKISNKQYLNNKSIEISYDKWLEENNPTDIELEQQRQKKFLYEPLISVVVPTYNTKIELLSEMIDSVLNQTYARWELCIADASDKLEVRDKLRFYGEKDKRIKINYLNENKGISENTNEAIKLANGEYISLLDHDDIIYPNTLFEIVNTINDYNNNVDVIYTDEDKIDENGNRKNPFFKPDWSPDLLYSQMYIYHMLTFKKNKFDIIGGFRKEYDGSQDYDLMLRMSLICKNIVHIPKVLYSWRELETSTSINPNSKPYAHIAGLNALNNHLNERYNGQAYALQTENLYVYDTRFKIDDKVKVSIIIPTKDKLGLVKSCIESIINTSTYKNYEILILNNNSKEKETLEWFKSIQNNYIRVIDAPYEFNWSKLNNHGIREAKGDVFIFLNNDTLIISEDWIQRLAENALREEIGTVGALLLYEDGTIQHSGVVLGMKGWAEHVYKGISPSHIGTPYVSPIINRNVLASTGACLAISRKTIEKIGNFNEEFIICGSDVEISLRASDYGLYNLMNANVKLYHLESKSRDSFIPEIDFKMSEKHYRKYLDLGDPYYNKNLNLDCLYPTIK